jgi:hypothetical protein
LSNTKQAVILWRKRFAACYFSEYYIYYRKQSKIVTERVTARTEGQDNGTFVLVCYLSIDKNKKQCKIGSKLPNKKGVFYEV